MNFKSVQFDEDELNIITTFIKEFKSEDTSYLDLELLLAELIPILKKIVD